MALYFGNVDGSFVCPYSTFFLNNKICSQYDDYIYHKTIQIKVFLTMFFFFLSKLLQMYVL